METSKETTRCTEVEYPWVLVVVIDGSKLSHSTINSVSSIVGYVYMISPLGAFTRIEYFQE